MHPIPSFPLQRGRCKSIHSSLGPQRLYIHQQIRLVIRKHCGRSLLSTEFAWFQQTKYHSHLCWGHVVVIAIATYDHAVVVHHGPPCGACIWQACLSDVRASSFRASSGLESTFFCDFGLWAGLGSAKFATDGQSGKYLCTYRTLNF